MEELVNNIKKLVEEYTKTTGLVIKDIGVDLRAININRSVVDYEVTVTVKR